MRLRLYHCDCYLLPRVGTAASSGRSFPCYRARGRAKRDCLRFARCLVHCHLPRCIMEPSSQTVAPVIEMHDVAVGAMRDQSLTVVEGVNWRVSPGDYWAVAGLQGAGKSDFLMMTAGLMPPLSGDYKLF